MSTMVDSHVTAWGPVGRKRLFRGHCFQLFEGVNKTAGFPADNGKYQDKTDQHHGPLKDVGPNHASQAAESGVDHHNQCKRDNAPECIDAAPRESLHHMANDLQLGEGVVHQHQQQANRYQVLKPRKPEAKFDVISRRDETDGAWRVAVVSAQKSGSPSRQQSCCER